MSRFTYAVVLSVLLAAPAVRAQQAPQIGYLYPAGGRQGSVIQVAVGGQHLDGAAQWIVSGGGVDAAVVSHTKPLTQQQANRLRDKLQEVQAQVRAARSQARGRAAAAGLFDKLAAEAGLTAEDLDALLEFRRRASDPKRQPNPQIGETVVWQVRIAEDAPAGPRELRLVAAGGLSNPLRFHIGELPEQLEREPNDRIAEAVEVESLPVVLNGQILPGDVDRFVFPARRGQRLVAAASARELVPYLADTVPGWFQAALVLYDPSGKEVAYADGYRFHPDPVLLYEIPEDGRYALEIRDALYRGREDFVYRVTLGEVPFGTSIFPLGGPAGDSTRVQLSGWNLIADTQTLESRRPGTQTVPLQGTPAAAHRLMFATDTLPEVLENEANDTREQAQRVTLPVIVNGRIDPPGDWDVFRFEAVAGQEIVAEVQARRLNSPLDSWIELTDDRGRQLSVNDDDEDPRAGLATHHADSRLAMTIPADGTYYLRLGDAQRQGGSEYGYRLRIGPPRPDFELRVVPSTVNARPGMTVPLTVWAVRRDGFAGDILLDLVDPPPGFAVSGGWVPGGQDRVQLTLSVPSTPRDEPVRLRLEGRATVGGRELRRDAVPAEHMMQAFAYQHLVPAQEWLVAVTGRGRGRGAPKLLAEQPLQIPAGGTARVQFSPPGNAQIGQLGQLQVVLHDPPEGLTIQRVAPGSGTGALLVRADATVPPGLKGNLILHASAPRAAAAKPAARNAARETLPAIAFEIVPPRP